MEFTHEAIPEMGMKVSPRLIAANQILEMSSQELQQAVSEELAENPALEMTEAPRCPVCGGELENGLCLRCQVPRSSTSSLSDLNLDATDEGDGFRPSSEDDDDFDPMTIVAAELTLGERLLEELLTMVADEDRGIAEYLVGSLDDNGYLQCSVAEAADFMNVTLERVETVLRQLQGLEPAGIGARDLRESLLLQLDRLAEDGLEAPHTRQIVSEYIRELAEHRYGVIASQLNIPYDEVSDAVVFIRQFLNPYPAQGYTGTKQKDTPAIALVPDLIIRRANSHFEVDVVESRRFVLRLSPVYQTLARQMEAESKRYSEEEREHIRRYLGRARFFLANINQRRVTIQRIAEELVGEQREFLERGVHFLKPLTRATLAKKLGVHESTVSRAIAEKYARLPSGEVVPLSQFFIASLGVKETIREIVAAESQPLSDQDIVERLAERGIKVARRTVAKYRAQLRILPSVLRTPRPHSDGNTSN
jgi:RNA polymerase sigma-54 factor